MPALLAGGVGGVGDREVLRQLGRGAAGPCRTWTCTEEPLGFGGLTEAKSEPSTTCTVLPIPVTRSIVGSANADATVAAACSLPGEKNTVVEVSGPGIVVGGRRR